MTWSSRFARGFSPSRWLRDRDGLRQLSEGGGAREWVLARAFCAYTVLDGAAVPPRKRRAFADMAVARWAPFPDAQAHVEWAGDQAMVWAWSRAQVGEDADGQPLPPARRILPESLLRGSPMAEGEALEAMGEGCEGRIWRDGVLAAARWWPESPDLEDWNAFRRGAGLPPASGVPPLQVHDLAARSWSGQRALGLGEAIGAHRRLLLAAGVGIASAAVSALLVAALALQVSIWQVDRDIAAREQALQKIIAARDAALAAQAEVGRALALRPPAGQLELLSLLPRLLPGNVQLLEWKLSDPQTLELTARMPNPDPRAIVTAFEASKRFAEVTAQLGRQPDMVVVRARILPAPAVAAGGEAKAGKAGGAP